MYIVQLRRKNIDAMLTSNYCNSKVSSIDYRREKEEAEIKFIRV